MSLADMVAWERDFPVKNKVDTNPAFRYIAFTPTTLELNMKNVTILRLDTIALANKVDAFGLSKAITARYKREEDNLRDALIVDAALLQPPSNGTVRVEIAGGLFDASVTFGDRSTTDYDKLLANLYDRLGFSIPERQRHRASFTDTTSGAPTVRVTAKKG